MSTMPEKLEVSCPRCGEDFGGWDRPFSDPAVTSVCPVCGYPLARDEAAFTDGAWLPSPDDLDAAER
jgi:hypothetical protein